MVDENTPQSIPPFNPWDGGKASISAASSSGNRELYPGDIALFLVDSDTLGEVETDLITEHNS